MHECTNVGPANINIGGADAFVNGIPAAMAVSTSAIMPQQSTLFIITVPVGSFTSGVAYTLKITTPDGNVFSYSVVCGSESGTAMTQIMPVTTSVSTSSQTTSTQPLVAVPGNFLNMTYLMLAAVTIGVKSTIDIIKYRLRCRLIAIILS
jgi:hypothetical protein